MSLERHLLPTVTGLPHLRRRRSKDSTASCKVHTLENLAGHFQLFSVGRVRGGRGGGRDSEGGRGSRATLVKRKGRVTPLTVSGCSVQKVVWVGGAFVAYDFIASPSEIARLLDTLKC